MPGSEVAAGHLSIDIAATDDATLITAVQALAPGDPEREAASMELVSRYQYLVHSFAAQYRYSPESQDELTQAGYLGLISAISHFDPSIGASLPAYARPCISGEIKRHFRDKRWPVRVRRAAQEARAGILRAEAELAQSMSRTPGDQEIADHLQVTIEEVREGRSADRAFHALSLDAPAGADPDAGTLGDLLSSEESAFGNALDMEAVWTHIGELPDRQQQILSMRFYGNMTQSQIGDRLGISQMHVSRLLTRALSFLRKQLEA